MGNGFPQSVHQNQSYIKMKTLTLIGFLCLVHLLPGQTFTESLQSPPLKHLQGTTSAFSDINGDGYEDLLMTGYRWNGSIHIASTHLYLNDSLGHFSEVANIPFDSVADGDIAFADVNGDGYEDVLITGELADRSRIAKLYTNDGTGTFTQIMNAPFEGIRFSSVAFADINGDNSLDVLLTGETDTAYSTKLYTNDGTGIFTEVVSTPFANVAYGSVAFLDANGDGSRDVIITGASPTIWIGKLYLNDGLGNFTESNEASLSQAYFSDIATSDVNGDGYEDVLITGFGVGEGIDTEPIAHLFVNDGTGSFTQVANTPLIGVSNGSIAFADVNNDTYEDVLIAGSGNSEYNAKLYTNDGLGNFTEVIHTPFIEISSGSVAAADVNNDGNQDFLISGHGFLFAQKTKLYLNEGIVSSLEGTRASQNLAVIPFPNPLSGSILRIQYASKVATNVQIKIYDPTGRLLTEQHEMARVGSQSFAIDVGELPPGNYLIHVSNEHQTETARFLVQE